MEHNKSEYCETQSRISQAASPRENQNCKKVYIPVSYDAQAMLHVNDRAYKNGYRDAVLKTCEFLKSANAAQAIVIRKGIYNMKEFSVIEFTDNFIEQYKKHMNQ